ncbi:MAG: hypothetical protein H6618_01215 [Deltaproteobacteria bacterium]|nr:hypothetical protein [Deltaproteobacteria bacterium]
MFIMTLYSIRTSLRSLHKISVASLYILAGLCLLWNDAKAAPAPSRDLSRASFSDIIRYYQFVGDFAQHEPARDISKEFFWRYPFPLPKAEFPIKHSMGESDRELPLTPGSERPAQHMNYGRVLFRRKNFEEARKVWLAARAKYGTSWDFHRRNDYFIALAYLRISEQIFHQLDEQTNRSEVRLSYSNAATFLSWAFVKKQTLNDPALEAITPEALYNLAAIYFRFDRYNGAHSTAELGLNYLRKTGRRDFRPELRRIILETWIRDHNYLRAVQEIDTMIRQDPNPEQASHGFARAGDIYFDLNNYELAEEAYRMSQAIQHQTNKILPLTFLLRGESLFWAGKFSEAQKAIRFALDSLSFRHSVGTIPEEFRAWGLLRFADAWLARFRQAVDQQDESNALHARNKTKIAYFNVIHDFPGTEAAEIAAVRQACLMLPEYQGNNVRHARDYLNDIFTKHYSSELLELAGSCEVLSWGRREKNDTFVKKLKSFYERFPQSRFLSQFIQPLRELRSGHLKEYLDAGEDHKAILYFEMNRNKLFQKLTEKVKSQLFLAYLKSNQSEKAAEFYDAYRKETPDSSQKKIDLALFLSEIIDISGKNIWKNRQDQLIMTLIQEPPKIQKSDEMTTHIQRIIQSSSAPLHQKWLYQAFSTQEEASTQYLCESIYPVFSGYRKTITEPQDLRKLWQQLSSLTRTLFPDLFSQSLPCSQAFLDLERSIGMEQDFLPEYANSWLTRMEWPHKKITAPLIWLAAKSLKDDQAAPDTRDKLLLYLKNLPKKDYPESAFAAALLDQQRTETGRLWGEK